METLNDIKKEREQVPDFMYIQRLEEHCEQLEKAKSNLSRLLINTITVNIELMDEYIPDWRIVAKENIEKLKSTLK